MPLRCQDNTNRDIHAFNLNADQWERLRSENKAHNNLRMPCCDNKVVLKTSKLGTQFFAHVRKGICTSKPESEEHLKIKSQVARALAKNGWGVATEVRGQSEGGEDWVADVMASKGDARFAVEIQWSRQKDADTYYRQERYQRSGIRALWMFRQEEFPIDKDVPSARVSRDVDGEFYVSVSLHRYLPSIASTHLSVEDFITAICQRRFWFGVFRSGDLVTATLKGAFIKCWKCKKWTRVVSTIELSSLRNPEYISCDLAELGKIPALHQQLPLCDLQRFKVGTIRDRYSKTEGGTYLGNACVECDALQGKFFLNDISHRLEEITSIQFTVTKDVEDALRNTDALYGEARWQVDPAV